MPYWFEGKDQNLPKGFDRRIKLTDKERLEIKELYRQGIAIREIARRFKDKCSRKLIQYIIFPERLEIIYQRAKDNENWKRYYDRDKRREYQRNHRRYKAKILGLKGRKLS